MDEGVRVRLEHGPEIGRRRDRCPHLSLVEAYDSLFAPSGGILRPLVEPLELVRLGRDREGSDALPLGVDAPPGDVGAHRIEVRHAQVVELIDLVGPAAQAVFAAVGEARLAEPAVAARCRPSDRTRLDERDAGVGVAPAGEQRRPEPGVPAAHDHQVGVVIAAERGAPRLIRQVVEPEHALARIGETALDDGCCRPLSFEDGRAHGYHFPVARCVHPRPARPVTDRSRCRKPVRIRTPCPARETGVRRRRRRTPARPRRRSAAPASRRSDRPARRTGRDRAPRGRRTCRPRSCRCRRRGGSPMTSRPCTR